MATGSELTAADAPPLPLESDTTRFFWDAVRAGRLAILRCQQCGHYIHYPRIVCNRCLSEDLAPEDVSGRGTLYSYSVVVQAFHPWFVDRVPYVLAVVELEEEAGLRLTTNLVDCPEDRMHIDLPVELVCTEVVPGVTLPFFRPRS